MLLVPPEQHLQNSLAVAALLEPAAPKLRAKEREEAGHNIQKPATPMLFMDAGPYILQCTSSALR